MNKLDVQEIANAVRSQMPAQRWQHTVGVVETSVKLALQYGSDVQKAELAAILHDYCKYWPARQQEEVLNGNLEQVPADLKGVLDSEKELWHAPAGAIISARDFGVEDEQVLNAIRYHTTGRENMTLLDKIVCLADCIEPGRDFPDVHKIREIADYSVERALLAGLNSTILFLIEKGKPIYPLTVMARNSLLNELKSGFNL